MGQEKGLDTENYAFEGNLIETGFYEAPDVPLAPQDAIESFQVPFFADEPQAVVVEAEEELEPVRPVFQPLPIFNDFFGVQTTTDLPTEDETGGNEQDVVTLELEHLVHLSVLPVEVVPEAKKEPEPIGRYSCLPNSRAGINKRTQCLQRCRNNAKISNF